MGLFLKIQEDVKNALKEKKELELGVLRMVFAAFKNETINLKKAELAEDECLAVLKHEAKKRKDSIEAYTKGNRQELAEKEKQELAIIQKYLPQQLSEEEIKKKVQEIVAQNPGLAFGPLMGKVMAAMKNQADGKIVQQILKNEISK
jgi:uncharacterized protein YqeY